MKLQMFSRNQNTAPSPLQSIEKAQFPIVMVPFYGEMVPVKLRKLTQAQTIACGNFSLVETTQDIIGKKKLSKTLKIGQIRQYSEQNHEIVKRALVAPTYDEIMEMITDTSVTETKDRIKAIEEKIRTMDNGPKRSELQQELDLLAVWATYILPEDFLSHITAFTLGVDESDIKELSEDALIQAAVLAERGHDNPADHIEGRFTAFMRDDINNRAWMLLQEKRSENGG